MSTWLINEHSPEYYGVRAAGWQFNTGSASTFQLSAGMEFDAAEKFAYDAAVTLKRDGTKFFQGRVRAIPKSGSASDESQDYVVEDVWAELERLVYQEPWLIKQADYAGPVYSPEVILGMNSAGVRINVGEQIAEVLAFAADQGLNLVAGTMPTGMMLWPSKVNGMSCAQVIRNCLRHYPDWLAWIDHTTTVPTFNVTPRASASSINLPVTSCRSFSCTKTHDRVPTGVRIVYLTANTVDDGDVTDVFRNMAIDQYPSPTGTPEEIYAALVAPAGPGMLLTTVELAGMNTQIQKSPIKTRTIATDDGEAKAYLKKKFPQMKAIPDANFTVTGWTRAVVEEDEDEADDIDEKLPRKIATTLAKMPRELVKGNLPASAQRYIGRMRLTFSIAGTGSVTPEETAILAKIPTDFVITGTNATTKIYKSVSNYTDAESVPVGIAQAYYNTLLNGCYFEGQATIVDAEISATRWHGSKVNLTGSANGDWATMGAPIHSVSYDLDTCEINIQFGPAPDLSFQDFTEFLQLLNKRTHTEYTTAERTGDTHGDEVGISAKGDSVGGYDGPETIVLGGSGGGVGSEPFQLVASGTGGDNILRVRESTLAGEVPAGFTAGFKEFTISDSAGVIYAKLTINSTTGAVTARAVEKASSMPSSTSTIFYEQIGSYTVTGSGGAAVISASNTRYGPIQAAICRNWYAAAAPYFGVTFS